MVVEVMLLRCSVILNPYSMQNWLCNQTSSPNLLPPSQGNTFPVQSAARLLRSRTPFLQSRTPFLQSVSLIPGTEAENEALQSSSVVSHEENAGIFRRVLLTASLCALPVISVPALAVPGEKNMGKKSPFNERRLLEQNKRIQLLNHAPLDFPGFIREGFNVQLVTTEEYKKNDSGLIYLDIQEGHGEYPKNGQQVVFHYIGYNESGRMVDSSYQQGHPAKTRLGNKAMIPGFEEGLQTMKPGGKRRLVIPPELGPPVGPSTFFSAKQFEVFDVELLDAKDCVRRTIGFYSDYVCD